MSEIRVGVFVCNCGTNIGGFLNVPELVKYARNISHVVFSMESLYTCSEDGLKEIQKSISEKSLNRVVVASCTPRTHEPLFRKTCEEAGLNPYLFEFVNIRDQCSWVHMHEKEAATNKAKGLIRMGVERAILLEPQEEILVDVIPQALVIGGGISGMTSALSLANLGHRVKLVEKNTHLGGKLNKLYKLYSNQKESSEIVTGMVSKIENSQQIEVFTSCEIEEVKGFVGNYNVTVIKDERKHHFDVGVIIVATGAETLIPNGIHSYNGENIITQMELEERLKKQEFSFNTIVMIQCVGSRDKERSYCSKTCCLTALKNAMFIKENNPKAQVFMLFRQMMTQGPKYERYYEKAREIGVVFIKYSPQKKLHVSQKSVTVYDEFLGEVINLPYDIVVLSTATISNPDSFNLSQKLKVPIDKYGFFLEAHVKLRPLDFATDGIYVCGSAHWPADISESISQAYGAASRASIPLSLGRVSTEPLIAVVDRNKCTGCGLCEFNCPFSAIRVEDTDRGRKATVVLASCKGCGACGAGCPEKAILMQHFTDEQILAQLIPIAEVIT